MGIRIVAQKDESVGLVLKRLEQQLALHGVSWEMRRRRYFVDPTQVRRAKRFQKRFKARQATLLQQMAGQQPVSSVTEAKAKFWKRTGKP